MDKIKRKKVYTLLLYMCLTGLDSVAMASSSVTKTTKVINNCCAILSKDPVASLPPSFTICSTVMAPKLENGLLVFFNILGRAYQANGPHNGMNLHVALNSIMGIGSSSDGVGLSVNWKQQWKELEENGTEFYALNNQWIKGCVAYNGTSGLYQMVVDGVFVVNRTRPDRTLEQIAESAGKDPLLGWSHMPTDLSGKIALGTWLNFQGWVPVSHKLTNLNIFSNAHSVEVMRQNTKGGKCIEDGDYLAWKDMEWTLVSGAEIETIDVEEPCQDIPLVDVYDTQSGPERNLNMESCMQHCEKLRSRAPSVTTIEEWNTLKKFFLSYRHRFTFELWVAINDNNVEGEWRDYYTDEVMNHTEAWGKPNAAPNGQTRENCASLVKGIDRNPVLDDTPCDTKHFCMCMRKPQSYLKLRGLCNNSAIETFYWPRNDPTEIKKLKLSGFQSDIDYNALFGMWSLSYMAQNITGMSKASLSSFTLGKHNWTIKGDTGCNKDINIDSYTTELKMSGCVDGQFTCFDGQCVSMDKRCDQLPNCRDDSDEKGCDILVLKGGYNRNIPPITSDKKGQKIAVNVNTSIDIFKLVDINEEDYSIEIQFQITLVWKENRATYQNLKVNDSLNALTQDDINKLWLPKVIYENTDQKETTRLGVDWEWETKVKVRREGNFTKSGLEIVDETYIYQGNHNSLIMSQTYTHEFQCQYDFMWYPFDTQVNTSKYIELKRNFIRVLFSIALLRWRWEQKVWALFI